MSFIPFISNTKNTRLAWFSKRLEHIYILSPAPLQMSSGTERESARPDRYLRDYVSWLRYLSNDFAFAPRLVEALKPVMDGFLGMHFQRTGETAKELRFTFNFDPSANARSKDGFDIPFSRLSDGQRCLTALYTSLLAAEQDDTTLLWDEPDNYVALREIQPWLTALRDLVEEKGKQCLLISHHPELINAFAAEHGVTVYRDNGGPARVKPFEWKDDGGVSPAEIVARGWEQ